MTKLYIFRTDAAEQIALTGLPQSQFAERAKIDRSNLYRRITERSRVRLTTAARIAQVFAELRSITQREAIDLLFEEAPPE